MSLVTLTQVLSESESGGYAVGSFGATEYHVADCIVQTAEELGLPVILMIAGRSIPEAYGDRLLRFLRRISEDASVPVCLHLDHGRTFEVVERAMDAGFSSVMYDGSALPLEENIANTAAITCRAHARGISVEAELGYIPAADGVADRARFTKPADAVRFRAETDIDALAVAFGTVHGLYREAPDLDFELVETIHRLLDIPLVMHGGTGTSDADMRRLIGCGIRKINIFTELAVGAADAAVARRAVPGVPGQFGGMTDAAREVVCAALRRDMDLFGTRPLAR